MPIDPTNSVYFPSHNTTQGGSNIPDALQDPLWQMFNNTSVREALDVLTRPSSSIRERDQAAADVLREIEVAAESSEASSYERVRLTVNLFNFARSTTASTVDYYEPPPPPPAPAA